MQATLLQYGLRLRELPNKHTTWQDVYLLLKYAPPDSPFYKTINANHGWQDAEYMLAGILDAVNWLVWAKTEDGARGVNRPKPVPRPGQDKPSKYGTPVRVTELLAGLSEFWSKQ